jgi:hypothetical protein
MPLDSKVFVSGSYVETGEVQVGVFAGQFVGSGCIVLLREVALRKPNNKPIGNDTDQLPRQDLTKPEISLTEKERARVKKVTGGLLSNLKKEKLVLDWRERQQARASVGITVEEQLDQLHEIYTERLYWNK